VTEGNGHVIDPGGAARRALQAAVTEHGPQALSDADLMDRVGHDQLAELPAEAALISRAARADVAGQLRDQIPPLGNYGAIQSVASALAEAGPLEKAGCLWVVREFARALSLVAAGGTQAGPGSGERPDDATAGGAASSVAPAEPPADSTASDAQPEASQSVPGPPASSEADGRTTGWPGATGATGAAPQGWAPGPGGAPPQAGPPGRPASESKRPSRNVLGIAAAIALVAVYLGVAAAAHLAPFPAKTVAAASSPPSSSAGGQGTGATSAPAATPDAGPDPAASPTSSYDTLLSIIPADVAGQKNCTNIGTDVGATAVAQCSKIQGLAAQSIFYYSFSSQSALTNGFNAFLKKESFKKGQTSCTTGANQFTNFVVQCEDGFTSTAPEMTGNIAEYSNTDNAPIIVSSDNQQLVMVVMIGANDGDLLAYWKQLDWVSR
jgi:hypothetical protein